MKKSNQNPAEVRAKAQMYAFVLIFIWLLLARLVEKV